MGGWLLLAGCSSLFDDADVTLGAPRPATDMGVGPTKSLFGGVKMSLSTKELQQAGVGGAAALASSGLPVSGVYSLPRPQKKKVASATVSAALGSPRRGSLFDELPNAGASYPGAGVSASRYFTTMAPKTPASHTSLFEVSGLVLPLSRAEVSERGSPDLRAFSLPDPLYTHRSAAHPQVPQQPASEEQESQVCGGVLVYQLVLFLITVLAEHKVSRFIRLKVFNN